MKKLYISILVFLAAGFTTSPVFSQLCDPTTPQFIVNLSGQPSGTWISTSVVRQGYCCGITSGPDKCLEFIITLDSSASSINFGIASGAIPPGALFYQINCGPPVQVGSPVCLNGPGPHILTFCKPGNNLNTYQITSIPKPSLSGSPWVSQQCPGQLNSAGLEDTSITWTSIPPNALYNSYLSCLTDCDTVTITPSGLVPVYVDYQVCGTVIGGCIPGLFCDTLRVFFINNLAVNITPQNPFVCFGSTTATVTANPSGGVTPYTYLWSNGATTQSTTVGAGTYTIQMYDTLACAAVTDTVVVSTLPAPISANAGIDQLFCIGQQSVTLNGTVNVASGGQWMGGNGTFSPNNTTLNATYSPTAAEITAGTVQLILVTTGNYSCPADTDVMVITISPSPVPSISGITSACAYLNAVYTAPLVSGINYSWSVSGGNIAATNNNSITVTWTTIGSGTVTLTETNAAGCDSTVTITVTINPQPTPVIIGPDSICTSTVSTYTVTPVAGSSYSWLVTGGTITGSSTNSSVNVQWSTAGNGTITVTQSNSFGCDSTVMIPVKVLTIPTPVITGIAPVCQMQTVTYSTPFVAGNTYTWNVTGGTVVSTNNNSITINWPTAGSGTITLTQANTLICDSTVTLNVTVGPQPIPVVTGPDSVCTSTISTYAVATPVAGNSYNWVVTGGTITGSSTSSNVNVQWSTAGNGTITVTQSNSFGCDSTVMIPVVVLTIPAPVISGIQNVCAMQTITYSTPFVAGNTYTWNVTGGTVVSNNNNSITVNWPAAGSGTITLTQANTLICDSTVTLNVTIGPQPIPVINGPNTVCTSTVSTYTVTPVAGNSYSWVVTGGTITGSSANSSVNVQWNTAGNGTITVTQSNSFGCDSTVMMPVVILTNPAPVISGIQNVCAMQTITYSTPFVAGNTYTWNVTGGTVVSNNNNSITVNWPAAGSGTITLTQANTLICDSTVTLNVTIGPQPIPVINGPNTVCTSTTSTYAVTPIAGNTYNWVVTGGTITGSSTNSNVNVQWNTAGNGTITVTQSNSFGCDSTVMIPVVILTNPVPVISGIQNVCAMQTVTYSTPFVAGNTYTWNVTGGNIISNNNNSITVSWPTAGSGTITLTQANTLICDSTVTLNVTIGPQPVPVINGPNTVCTSTVSTYSVVTPVPGNSYNWVVTGGTITGSSTNSSVNVQWSTAGNGTITVTQSNSFGCDSTVMIPVVVLTTPAPVISGAQNVCEMQTITYSTPFIAGNTYSWNVTGGTVVSNNNNSITVNWPAAGSGTITLTQANTLICDSTVMLNIVIGPQPIPVINGPDSVCTSTISTYAVTTPVAGNSYSWAVTGGTITGSSANSNVNVQWNTAGNGTITVTQSNSFGCDSTVMIPVVVLTIPAPVISGTQNVCEMQTITYSTPFFAGNTYTWNVIGGTIVSNNNNSITVNWPTAGSGTITLTQANTLICDSTVTLNVTVGPQPIPVITGPDSVCTSTISTYTVATPVAGNSYNWVVTGGTITGSSANSSVNVQWSTAGSGTITVTQSNSFGCDSTVMIPVVVLTIPAPVISGTQNVCEMQTITYSTPFVAGNTYTWNVTGGTVVSTNNNSININWPAAGSGTITLTQANTLICDSTVTINIVIGPQPIPVIAGPVLICTFTNGQYSVVNPVAGNFYNWTVTGGTITGAANTDNINVLWNTAGTGMVNVTQSNSFGCDSTVSYAVVVKLKPTPTLSGPPINCEMDTTTYSVQNVIGDTYIWNVTGGSIIGLSVGSSIEVLWTTLGNGEVELRQISPDGCDSVVTKSVYVNPLPQPLISGPVTVCEDELAVYNVTSVNNNLYNWSASGGYISGSTTSTTINVTWPNDGMSILTVIETTPQGCSVKAELLVLINEKPHPSVTGSNVGCISNALNNYSSMYQPGIDYLWSISGGNIITGNGTSAIAIQWTTPGLQTISITAINPLTGCDSTVLVLVNVDSLARPVIQTTGFTGCVPVKIDFSGNIINPDYYYSWDFGDGSSINTANPFHQYSEPGTYAVQLIATNNTGCRDTVSAEVIAYPNPVADFNLYYGTPPYMVDLSILEINNLSTGATQYSWDFGDARTSSLFEPQHDYKLPGTYTITLIATNQWGCSNSAEREIIVKVPEDIFVPNAFSPNNDHKNDYFKVSHRNITQLSVSIFNRWGERLYTSDDISFKWDGTFKSTPVQEGVYVYAIQAKGYHGKIFKFSGNLTVIR